MIVACMLCALRAKGRITKQKFMQAKVLKVEDAEQYLCSLANGNLDDEDFRRRLIHNFIRRVYVYEDKVKIVYYFGGGDEPDYEDIVGDGESPIQKTSCSYEMGQGARKASLRVMLFSIPCA